MLALSRRRRVVSLVLFLSSAAGLAQASCSSDDASGGAADAATNDDATTRKDDASTSEGGSTTDAGSGNDANATDSAVTDAGTDAADGGPDASLVTCTASPCAIHLAAGTDQACVILSDKTVRCWGSNFMAESGQAVPSDGGYGTAVLAPLAVSGIAGARELSLGAEHSCALLENGTVQCWGSNRYAQLAMAADGGLAGAVRSPTPVTIAVTGTPANVSAGFYHTCIRRTDGSVQCWGYNSHAQIGNVLPDGGDLPLFVPAPTDALLTGVAELDVGGRFACGHLFDGGVSCWGHNANGQLGRGGPPYNVATDPRPAPVVGLPANVDHLGRSVAYTEGVVLDDKTVRIWGSNQYGNLGPVDGGSTGTPLEVASVTNVAQIAFNLQNTCVLKTDGTVFCWGATYSGGGGVNPDAGIQHPTPAQISGVSDAVAIALGWDVFGCALKKDGSVVCWGDNAFGQLGRGLTKAALPFDPVAAPVAF